MTADRQPLRRPLTMVAELRERGSCSLPVTVLDLALDRCRLWAGFRLQPGREATLAINQFAAIKATILWSNGGYAELHLDRALHPAILDHLVMRHPPDENTPGATSTTLLDQLGRRIGALNIATGR